MEKSGTTEEIHTLSFDSVEETSCRGSWYELVQHFTYKNLETLRDIFKKNCIDYEEIGLSKDEFNEAVCTIFGDTKYINQSTILFEAIAKNNIRITWNDLLDFLIEHTSPKTDYPLYLSVSSIEPVPHMARETIVKIVLIETEKYFCYAVVSKHGRVGLYDGNLNFLISYHTIMTREDIERNDNERRRRNRWITDAIFCLDIQMFILTNSTRSITIYEASGLRHEPYWLIIGVPDIIQCLAYKSISKERKYKCILFGGTDTGEIYFFKFKEPEVTMLRRKYTDKINLFYWLELSHEKSYIAINFYKNVHSREIEQMEYNNPEGSLITCSRDADVSLVKKFLNVNKEHFILKMRKGCNCFGINNTLNILVTASDDRIIRIWNAVLVSNLIAVFKGHDDRIIDVSIMENLRMVLSFSEDGVLKVWDINQNKCLQTVSVQYPAFTILGKFIEFGRKNLYPGPKRNKRYSASEVEDDSYKKYFGISEVEERSIYNAESKRNSLNAWERSPILAICCNYIAKIRVHFENADVEKLNEMAVLQPPPLQNSVLIPASWQIQMRKSERERDELLESNYEQSMKNLDFIINKNLFDIEGSKTDINYKIAILESKKLKMKDSVSRGAPFLALDLCEVEEVKLSENLRTPAHKDIKNIVKNIQRILSEASIRDQVFSETSSCKSRLSSRSSVVSLI